MSWQHEVEVRYGDAADMPRYPPSIEIYAACCILTIESASLQNALAPPFLQVTHMAVQDFQIGADIMQMSMSEQTQ